MPLQLVLFFKNLWLEMTAHNRLAGKGINDEANSHRSNYLLIEVSLLMLIRKIVNYTEKT